MQETILWTLLKEGTDAANTWYMTMRNDAPAIIIGDGVFIDPSAGTGRDGELWTIQPLDIAARRYQCVFSLVVFISLVLIRGSGSPRQTVGAMLGGGLRNPEGARIRPWYVVDAFSIMMHALIITLQIYLNYAPVDPTTEYYEEFLFRYFPPHVNSSVAE